jgi:hypothetical protein
LELTLSYLRSFCDVNVSFDGLEWVVSKHKFWG